MDLFEVLVEQVGPILIQAIVVVLGVILTWLGYQSKNLVDKMKDTKEIENIRRSLNNNKELVAISVEYVEQVAENIPSGQKKELAKLKFIEFANKYNIEISEVELDTLIEQAVYSFKHGYEQAGEQDGKELHTNEVSIYNSSEEDK